ncbi:hypothetical protein PBOI14_51060 [Pseudomonas sp. Boi14]|nr:hypothetical protein PBOI14_51060 [Pseudomonas sp. Boi14]
MKFPGRFTSGFLLLFTSCAALAQSELDVRVKPANDELKANVEGYIGSVGDRDEEALLRFSRGAEEQAKKAARPWATTNRISRVRCVAVTNRA